MVINAQKLVFPEATGSEEESVQTIGGSAATPIQAWQGVACLLADRGMHLGCAFALKVTSTEVTVRTTRSWMATRSETEGVQVIGARVPYTQPGKRWYAREGSAMAEAVGHLVAWPLGRFGSYNNNLASASFSQARHRI